MTRVSAAARRRWLWRALAAWTLAALLAALGPRLFGHGLVGSIYYGRGWSGSPRQVVVEVPGSDDWVAPLLSRYGTRSFSASWDGWVHVTREDTFDFATVSDDGSWLYVDGALVVDNGGEHSGRRRQGSLPLTRGLHRIRIDYEQIRGGAELQVLWAPAGRELAALTGDVLYPTRAAYFAHTTWQPAYLMATLGSCAMLLGAAAWGLGRVRRHAATRVGEPALNAWLWRLLALSAVLILWQVWYGLPDGWENDELRPREVIPGLEMLFSGGWYDHYPPLYFYVLALVSLPFKLGAMTGAVDLWSEQAVVTQAVLYRGTAVLCGVAVVYLVYRCGLEAFGRRVVGLWAGFVIAVTPNVVYLSKLAKPEVSLVAPFMAAMLAYLRAMREPGPSTYGTFAFFGILAICVKDQAYGLFALPALHLVWLRLPSGPAGWASRLGRLARDPALARAALVAAGVFVFLHNLAFNLDGFREHLVLITGGGSQGFRIYPATLPGHVAMLANALWQVSWMFGVPVALLVVAGIVLAWRERRDVTLALLLPIVSYYVFFIAIIGYQYDRFYLAPAALLAIFAGVALAWLATRRSVWGRAAAVGVAAYSLAYGASVNLMMAGDGRIEAETWLRTHTGRAMVAFVGPMAYLPRPAGLLVAPFEPDWDAIDVVAPEFLVINAEYARRPRMAEFYRPLLDGTHPDYRLVATFKSPPGAAILAYGPLFRNGVEDDFTNLDKINPEIRVYARRDVAVGQPARPGN